MLMRNDDVNKYVYLNDVLDHVFSLFRVELSSCGLCENCLMGSGQSSVDSILVLKKTLSLTSIEDDDIMKQSINGIFAFYLLVSLICKLKKNYS